MKRRFEQIANPAPLWQDDVNYPGVPKHELAAKTTSRATVDYDTYVLRYAARQRGNVLLITAGVMTAVGAAIYLSGAALVLIAAGGIGAALAGCAGFVVAAQAHGSYTRDLAVSVSETWHRNPPPRPATVRPFVASNNGDGKTTTTGRLDFTPGMWRDLFDLAMKNGGVVNRDDVAKPARIGREWYHGAGYGSFLSELTHLGFIDDHNRLTPAALAWYEQQIALPLTTATPRSPRSFARSFVQDANEQDETGGVGEWS